MRLEIPFFKQTSPQNCGPTALRMVLAYFGKDEGVDILETRTGIKKGKGSFAIQIAVAAAVSGYTADFYSKHILFNEEKFSCLWSSERLKWMVDAKAAGVNIQEKTLSLEELLGYVKKDSIPIILLDWNTVKSRKEKGYQGHFVPVVGFDEQNVYVHSHGLNEPKEFMPITRNIFDKARKEAYEDTVIVYKK